MKYDFNKILSMVDILPNQKRAAISVIMVGMGICQALGSYNPAWGHVFTGAEWGAAIGLFMVAFQLKQKRDEEEKTNETK